MFEKAVIRAKPKVYIHTAGLRLASLAHCQKDLILKISAHFLPTVQTVSCHVIMIRIFTKREEVAATVLWLLEAQQYRIEAEKKSTCMGASVPESVGERRQ